MSKKSKRQVSRQYAPRPTAAQPVRSTEFNPDYSNTKRELRRIGILAGSFIVVMIVLAIFQNQLLALFLK